ncbi:MAG: hypothetical protein HFJ34_05775, partial [Clostridia bacterium]|nr:hypothetical protein [Clostridia bacterium]
NPSSFYGATVTGYDCPNSAGVNAWKIFYADENNIYIIADDYIHYDYCPPSATQAITKNSDYKLSFNDIIKDYPNGSAHITNEKIKALNNDYFNVKGYTSTNDNMKAVAYMLDTNVWSGYKGSKAEYAIGGPSVEMLLKSYNQKYNTSYLAGTQNDVGYYVSGDGGNSWKHAISIPIDSLYTITDTQKAVAMWLASPSIPSYSETSSLVVMDCDGYVNPYFYYLDNATCGFRPLVCLNSDVQLEKKSDGTYAIK